MLSSQHHPTQLPPIAPPASRCAPQPTWPSHSTPAAASQAPHWHPAPAACLCGLLHPGPLHQMAWVRLGYSSGPWARLQHRSGSALGAPAPGTHQSVSRAHGPHGRKQECGGGREGVESRALRQNGCGVRFIQRGRAPTGAGRRARDNSRGEGCAPGARTGAREARATPRRRRNAQAATKARGPGHGRGGGPGSGKTQACAERPVPRRERRRARLLGARRTRGASSAGDCRAIGGGNARQPRAGPAARRARRAALTAVAARERQPRGQ
jgi:hypothetical protein